MGGSRLLMELVVSGGLLAKPLTPFSRFIGSILMLHRSSVADEIVLVFTYSQ